MIAVGCIVAYLVGAVFGWRVGYVRAYEDGRRRYPSLGHESAHRDGLFFGSMSAMLWPVALPLFFVGAHLTPIPPSRRADLLDERERELERLEREAGIR